MCNLTVGDSLSRTFDVVFKNLGTYLKTQGIFVFIVAVASLAFTLTIGNSATGQMQEAVRTEDMTALFAGLGAIIGGAILLSILGFFVGTLAFGMGIVVSDGIAHGERLTFAEAWARVSPRLGNLLGTTFLITAALIGVMLVGIALSFLIVPLLLAMAAMFYLLARWAVANVVSILEARTVTENLKRSSELTVGARGTIVGAVVILALLISIPMTLASLPAALSSLGQIGADGTPEITTPSLGMQLFSWAISTVGQFALSFLLAAFVTTTYRTLAPPAQPQEPVMPTPLGFDPVADDA